ncbi:MAG: hypothetical protein ACJZ8O_11785 [Pirellulaceae bacterium]
MARRKTRVNVYSIMLFISFLALVASCVLLWLEYKKWDTTGPAAAPAAHQIYSQPAEIAAYTVSNESYRS